ncbi:MAG: 3-deoxy-manno-octulosonate cytidylyltransferase [Gemmatimonadaceae bacterium]|nr:3-deoxy-manno-octulosonate cytidylyltransferase [Gemmatimonadaceae bacterium]
MSTLIVIPARLGAVRLPRKPLRLIGGSPMILQVWSRIVRFGVGDRVVVATDADEIAAVVRAAGGEVCLTRADHQSGSDRVAEVAARPEYAGHDVIVNVQGDEPFMTPQAVRGAIAMVRDRGFALGTAAVPATSEILANPMVVKVVTTDAGQAMYFSRAPIPFLRDAADVADRDARLLQHLGVYAYRPEALAAWVALPTHPLERAERLEQLRPLAAGWTMGVASVPGPAAWGIDTEEDLERANAVWPEFTRTEAAGAE